MLVTRTSSVFVPFLSAEAGTFAYHGAHQTTPQSVSFTNTSASPPATVPSISRRSPSFTSPSSNVVVYEAVPEK